MAVIDTAHGHAQIFEAGDALKVLKMVTEAQEVVTFNGKLFDMPVLSKACRLEKTIEVGGSHTDLWEKTLYSEFGSMNQSQAFEKFLREKINDVKMPEEQVISDVTLCFKLWSYYVGNGRSFDSSSKV